MLISRRKKTVDFSTVLNSLVPTEGLEPPHPKAHGPEPCASTNSATWALLLLTSCFKQDEKILYLNFHKSHKT